MIYHPFNNKSGFNFQKEFDRIFDLYYRDIYALCSVRFNKNKMFAKRSTREIFKLLYFELKKGKPIPAPRAWLYKTANAYTARIIEKLNKLE